MKNFVSFAGAARREVFEAIHRGIGGPMEILVFLYNNVKSKKNVMVTDT